MSNNLDLPYDSYSTWKEIDRPGEMSPEKEYCGARFSKVPQTFRSRRAIRKTPTRSFCKAGLFICCKGNKNLNNCKVSWFETPSFRRYKENYVTRNAPEKFRDFRETGPERKSSSESQPTVLLTTHFTRPIKSIQVCTS